MFSSINKTHKTLNNLETRGMHQQFNVHWKKARGVFVVDRNNNKYLDFTSGIFVANVGHSNKEVINEISKSLKSPLIYSYNYPHEKRINYLKLLKKFCKGYFEKFYLLSGGSESVEAAIKLSRLYGIKRKKRKLGIISLNGNWHGRTMGAQMLNSDPNQNSWTIKDKRNIFLDFPYPWKVKNKNSKNFFKNSLKNFKKKDFKKDFCAFFLESFQGWGAVFYPKNYVKEVEKFCKKNDILLVFDEMQAGFGRTGKNFGFQHYNVKPDLICCGKGMGSGFPISGVFGSKKILDLPAPGSMSSTNSANPLACAAGIATLKEFKNKNIVKNSEIIGKLFHVELNKIKKKFNEFIFDIQGKGLIAAIIFKDNINLNLTSIDLANIVCEKAIKNKLLVVRTGRESIKLGPPLIINKQELLKGVKILERSIFETIS